jgi:hypothetical protein
VKTLFWRSGGLDEARDIAVLDVSYRNSEAVTATANTLLKLKHARFGSVDRESNGLMRAVAGVAGEVRGLQLNSPGVAELDEQTRRSPRTAVVVLRDEHKVEARRHFRTPLVFSVHEAKGLEYENIILYRLVSTERRLFADLCEGVSDDALAKEALEYLRAKNKTDKSLEVYKFFINALYVGLTRAVVNAWLVEDDPAHPLWKKLGVLFGASGSQVVVAEASIEDWQAEAHRLEQQGKLEQAEAIRTTVLRLEPVPWTVLNEDALARLAAKALDPQGVSNTARQQLFDYACFHRDEAIADGLAAARFAPAEHYRQHGFQVVRRLRQPYEARNFKDLLWQTEKHGVDFRTPMNLTPLMMAAYAGNARLVEALLARGARRELRDHLGHLPLHWAIRRAYEDEAFARGAFGTVYDELAPPSFDAQVDGRLVQIGREQGEYFVFQVLIAQWCQAYFKWGRVRGFTALDIIRPPFTTFPDVVVREARQKRTYVNGVLARSEVASRYPASRQLWQRERQGHYRPNPKLSLRVALPDGSDTWRPVLEVLNVAWLVKHLSPPLGGRLPEADGSDAWF